jgi:helicase required for RNAi-mediated heterochromatin assembly 1
LRLVQDILRRIGTYLLDYRSFELNGNSPSLFIFAITNSCSFTLANHIVNLDLDVGPPRYLEEHPILDLSSPTRPVGDASSSVGSDDSALQNVNVLEHFPLVPNSGMDTSQTSALQRIITKSVAVVQGPPGTGKTFTSVSSLKILLNNLRPEDPPVIIAAQTNHALDQLIKHVQVSEESVVRLGGRCDRENVDIIKRTLYELRKVTKDVPNGAKGLKNCKTDLEVQIHKIQHLMSPFLTEAILTDEILLKNRLITEDQKESLYEPGWLEADQSQGVEEANTIAGCK